MTTWKKAVISKPWLQYEWIVSGQQNSEQKELVQHRCVRENRDADMQKEISCMSIEYSKNIE